MFTVFGVDLSSRWQEATTTEQAAEIYEQAKREAKKRYRAICRETHPDRGGDEERMKEVTALWSVIASLKPKYTARPPVPKPKSWLDLPPSTIDFASIHRQTAAQQQQAAFGQQYYASKVQRVQDIFNADIRTRTATVVTIHFPEQAESEPTSNK